MAHLSDTNENRNVLDRFARIITTGDYAALDQVLHPEFVHVMPQSGERVKGIENYRSILEHYPGGGTPIAIAEDFHVVGHTPHYVMTATFNVVRVEGEGDELTSYVKARYPDGSDWYIVSFTTFKDGKILQSTDFYAPSFEPPEWRAQWVETD